MRSFLKICLAVVFLAGCGEVYRDQSVPINSVTQLDVDRYLGRWYEIARYDNWFERGCVGVTADYGLRADGQISVTNTCREETLDGKVDVANGVARVEAPGQLTVTFTPWLPFARGDYWVLYLDEEYETVVIGSPSGRVGWILARTPQITPEQRAAAEAALVANGYDPEPMIEVLQPASQ